MYQVFILVAVYKFFDRFFQEQILKGKLFQHFPSIVAPFTEISSEKKPLFVMTSEAVTRF